jgi:hypothetical protein
MFVGSREPEPDPDFRKGKMNACKQTSSYAVDLLRGEGHVRRP